MASSPRLCFTVPTKDICAFCLKKCPVGSSPGCGAGGVKRQYSIQQISIYLDLDVRQIFNIKTNLVSAEGDAASDMDVDIEVTLCQSCADLRNAFGEMYDELLKIQRKMNTCVRGIREVMINAENNVGIMKSYFNAISGKKKQSLEMIRSSIPEKFRKETITKSSMQDFETYDETMDLTVSEPAVTAVANKVAGKGKNGKVKPEKGTINNSPPQQDGTRGYPDEDDEDDPEVLMMKYDANVRAGGKSKKRKRYHLSVDDLQQLQQEDSTSMSMDSSDINDMSDMNGSVDFEFDAKPDEDSLFENLQSSELSPSKASSNNSNGSTPNKKFSRKPGKPGTYGGRFECDICGKVVVSLKNFELHQRRHAGEKPFECTIENCQKTFRDTSNLRSHVLRYHRQFLFIKYKNEEVTLEEFQKGLDDLILSVLLPSPNHESSTYMSHACQLCDRSYTQRYAIEDHIVQRHYDTLAASIYHLQKEVQNMSKEELIAYMLQIQNEDSTARSCGLCGVHFETGEELNNHIKTHVKVNLIRKSKDESSTGTPTTTAAMASLSTPPPSSDQRLIVLKLKCEPCGIYFEDLSALNNHKLDCGNQSGSSALFKCEYCGKPLNSHHNYRRHLLSLHKFQVFSKYLPQGTKATELEEAIRNIFAANKTEPVAEGFKCFLCEKTITQKRKHNSHVLCVHFNQMVQLIQEELGNQKANGYVAVNGNQINGGEEDEVSIEVDEDDDLELPVSAAKGGPPNLIRVFDPMDNAAGWGDNEEEYMFGLSGFINGNGNNPGVPGISYD